VSGLSIAGLVGAAGSLPLAILAEVYRIPPLGQALFESMHNKIIHFPIVLTLMAALMLVLARRKPEFEPLAFWLVWAAALSALAAYFSGVYAEGEFEKDPKHWLAELHRKWGIAVGIAQAAWVLLLLRPRTRRFVRVWGFVVVGLVAVAAFLGGLVAHGE
jgi:uncharacterized membrane protein